MNYILDTNIISELISTQTNQKVIGWLKGVDAKQTFLSVITIGEIRKGIEKLPESLRKKNIQDGFENELIVEPAIRDIEEIAINLYHTLV